MKNYNPHKYIKDPITGCWNWYGAKNNLGYGVIKISGTRTNKYAHRFIYELLKAPIPNGLLLHHKCCNKSCVNPEHLEITNKVMNARYHYDSVK